MKIFDIFKKKETVIDSSAPYQSGTIEKQPSYIMTVPYDDSILNDTEALSKKLKQLPYIKLLSSKITDWLAFLNGNRITPDCVYKLEE